MEQQSTDKKTPRTTKSKIAGILFSPKGIKVKTRYRIVLLDENRFKSIFSFSARRGGMIMISIVIFFLCAVLGAMLLGVTPLRTLLPGYMKGDDRRNYIETANRVDSLARLTALNNLYLTNFSDILSDNIDIDSIIAAHNDTVSRVNLPIDSLLTTSDAEREFVKQYEQRERFNVSVLSPVAAEGMQFFAPVTGAAISSTDGSGHMSFSLPASAPVSSIYKGTVVDTYYAPATGHTVVIQHPNNFLSRYSGLGECFVKKGDRVRTGSRVGLARRKSSPDTEPVAFEMWYNGSQLNPTDYISF